MATVNVHDAKTHLARLIERAHAGEELILAKDSRPYACLVPLAARSPRVPGRYPEPIPDSFFDPLPAAELDAGEG
jgi:prevent-host-death family protein